MSSTSAGTQLASLRFYVSGAPTFGEPCCCPAHSSSTWTSKPLSWAELQQEAVVVEHITHASHIWLAHRGRDGSTAPLLEALTGAAPLPGLSAAAPACAHDRLPEVRSRPARALAASGCYDTRSELAPPQRCICRRSLSTAKLTPRRGVAVRERRAHPDGPARASGRISLRLCGRRCAAAAFSR
jgi:hypothetical protein